MDEGSEDDGTDRLETAYSESCSLTLLGTLFLTCALISDTTRASTFIQQ